MRPLALNMSKMKKISGTKFSSTFKHDDGHTITVSHAKLPAIQRKQLESMPMYFADGGEVPSKELKPENSLNQYVPEEGIVGGTIKDGSDQERFHFGKFTFDVEKARKFSKLEPNGEVPTSQLWIDKIKIDPEHAVKSASKNPVFIAQVHTPDGLKPLLIDGNHRMYRAIKEGHKTIEAHIFSPEESTALMTDKYEKPSFINNEGLHHYAKGGAVQKLAEGDPSVQQISPPAPTSIYQQQPVAPLQTQVPIQNAQANPPILNPNSTANVPQAVQNIANLAPQQQAVDVAAGKSKAIEEDAYARQRAVIAQKDQQHIDDMKQHTDEFSTWMKANPIDPNHWENSRAFGKVGAAMSLFLGGFASGLGNTGPLNFINDQINRDIDSQKATTEQRKSIFDAYNKLYDNQNIASNLTKVSMNDLYTHRMNQIADQQGTLQAKINAQMFQNMKAMESAQALREASYDPDIESAYNHSQQVTGKQPATPQQTPEQQSNFQPPSDSELSSDADKRLAALQYGSSQQKQDYEPTSHALNNVKLAESNIGGLKHAYLDAALRVEHGGVGGRIGRAFEPSTVGALPGGGGEAGDWITGLVNAVLEPTYKLSSTENTRAIDQRRSDLKKYVANALSGTKLGSGDINKYVDDHFPEYGDSPEQMKTKRDALIQYIRDNLADSRTLLKKHHMLKTKD